MDTFSLGPNGAMLYCLEYLEKNFDWLEEELERALKEGGWEERRGEAYIAFDTPGQVELSTDHGSLKRIFERLQKNGWRVSFGFLEPNCALLTFIRVARGSASGGRTSHHRCIKIRCTASTVAANDAANGVAPHQCPF